jgi:hypothetical protein
MRRMHRQLYNRDLVRVNFSNDRPCKGRLGSVEENEMIDREPRSGNRALRRLEAYLSEVPRGMNRRSRAAYLGPHGCSQYGLMRRGLRSNLTEVHVRQVSKERMVDLPTRDSSAEVFRGPTSPDGSTAALQDTF